VAIIYLLSHIYKLTLLPVFADEAIYIRWSQLIIDDWKRYLFFPMNDGKTPLLMWLMVPFQFIFSDQLFAGRFVAVLIGLTQVFANIKIVGQLGGRKIAKILTAILSCCLPFWFFHHRMALTDGLLVATFSWSIYYLLKINREQQNFSKLKFNVTQIKIKHIILAGIFFGLSFYSKLSATLFIPLLIIVPLASKQWRKKGLFLKTLLSALVIACGVLFFITLRVHPAFPQLFSRGGDFLYSVSDYIKFGPLRLLVNNSIFHSKTILIYSTWPIVLLSIMGLFRKNNKKNIYLLLSIVLFCLPLFMFGKVVYPRYFLPVATFLTVAASLEFEQVYLRNQTVKFQKYLKFFYAILISLTLISSGKFILSSYTDVSSLNLSVTDQMQYLHEWSAGFGTKETYEYIRELAKTTKVIVATEGFFGTLPDGLLMYFHRRDVSNIVVEGIGQPVGGIRQDFIDKNPKFDAALLIVNSHRMNMKLDKKYLIKEYSRPNNAPTLQVWDIGEYIEDRN